MIKRIVSILLLVSLSFVFISGVDYKQYSEEYYFKRNSSNKISLTFDDGPHPVYTRKILDILEKYNVKATFFIVGTNAGYYKDTLLEIVRSGHELGNHTFSHAILKDRNAADIISEVENCRNAIYDICGENTVLFRPPGGIITDDVMSDCEIFENYNIILWSIDTKDWAHRPAGEIADYVINATRSGDIILMHDYIQNSPTPEALEIIIPKLQNMGYEFVTVSELLASE